MRVILFSEVLPKTSSYGATEHVNAVRLIIMSTEHCKLCTLIMCLKLNSLDLTGDSAFYVIVLI